MNKALKIELDPTFIRIVYPTMEHRFTFTHEPLSMNELNALEAILILKLPGSMRPVKLYEAQVLKSIVYTKSEV